MAARRDYADEWRDAVATLAQVPVAGLLASNFLVEQWVRRTSTFATHVSTRFALQRRASRGRTGAIENLTADVLSEDLMDATRSYTRGLVSLPGEAAKFFDLRVEQMLREVLDRVQPDADKDLNGYVRQELDKVARDVERLRQVLRTVAARYEAPGRRRRPDRKVVAVERGLQRIQRAVDDLAERHPRPRPGPPRDRPRRSLVERKLRTALGLQRALDALDRTLVEMRAER